VRACASDGGTVTRRRVGPAPAIDERIRKMRVQVQRSSTAPAACAATREAERVLANLVANALDALRSAGGGAGALEFEGHEPWPRRRLWVQRARQADRGIAPDRFARVFTPSPRRKRKVPAAASPLEEARQRARRDDRSALAHGARRGGAR